MATLATAQSMAELKNVYRRLAAIHHPDRGGSSRSMQRVNRQYQAMQEKLKVRMRRTEARKSAAKRPRVDDFSRLQPGTILFVNTTACEVLHVTKTTFHAIALCHRRRAVFCRKTGVGKFNKNIRASFTRQRRPTSH